jgi:hypothetical protein
MNARSVVKPSTIPHVERLTHRQPAQDSGWATLPGDRTFKVLQPSRTPAQLSLFPPPGQVSHPVRNGR